MAARGHFEVFPELAPVGRVHTLSQDPAKGDELVAPVGWRWRFVDDQGRERAVSPDHFDSIEEAKTDAGDLVIAIRTATYGQRFPQEIADSVRLVDK